MLKLIEALNTRFTVKTQDLTSKKDMRVLIRYNGRPVRSVENLVTTTQSKIYGTVDRKLAPVFVRENAKHRREMTRKYHR